MRRRWKKFVASGRARMALVVVGALTAGSFVELRAKNAADIRNNWQPNGTVYVTTGSIDIGDVIALERVIATPSPAVLTPTDALTSINGVTAARPIVAGEILTTGDVVGPSTGPRGNWRWIAVPVDPVATPRLLRDDQVDLVGLDPFGAAATVVAASVRVIESGDENVVVEVDEAAVPAIAERVAGGLILVIRAPR